MNIGFFIKVNNYWLKQIEKLKKEFPEHNFYIQEEANDNIEKLEVIIGGKLDIDFIEKAKKLKVIFVPFAGVNHLPLDIIFQRGIKLTNSHGNARFVAERAIGMVIAFYGKIIEYHNDLKKGKWHGFWVGKGLEDSWYSIQDKTITILGAGSIGFYIAKFMKAFNAKVYGYKKKLINELPPFYDRMFYNLEEAIDNDSEIVFCTLPLTPETKGIINKKILNLMKNKFFVNVGRGWVVEEKDLFEALKNKVLKGAAIDSWYQYPANGSTIGYPSKYPFHKLDNVILSPHIGGFTPEAVKENAENTLKNLRYFLKTKKLKNEVKYY